MNIDEIIRKTQDNISEIVERVYPRIRAVQAKALFDAEGAYNGRSRWLENAPSTRKRKGDKPIMQDTGELYDAISDPGTFTDDNWERNIPNIDRYAEADKIRPFHDIGELPEDIEEIDKEIEKAIENELAKS